MSEDNNRRRQDRFSATDVHGNFSYSVEARVLNLSLGGLAVRTNTQLSIGRKYRFRLGDKVDAVQMTGAVRWCRMSGTEKQESGDIVPVYEAGISFDDVLTEKADELMEFMERNITLDVKQRISGRFKVDSSDPVVLKSETDYIVKQISSSGMMIEADIALKPGTVLELDMRLGRRKFNCTGEVIYLAEVALEDESLRHRLGVKFTKIPEARLSALEQFIRREMKKAGAAKNKKKSRSRARS